WRVSVHLVLVIQKAFTTLYSMLDQSHSTSRAWVLEKNLQTMSIYLDRIRAAHERIRPYIHRTPVLTSERLNEASGASLFFKCENFQKIGAFKARGATNAVFALDDVTAGA